MLFLSNIFERFKKLSKVINLNGVFSVNKFVVILIIVKGIVS